MKLMVFMYYILDCIILCYFYDIIEIKLNCSIFLEIRDKWYFWDEFGFML